MIYHYMDEWIFREYLVILHMQVNQHRKRRRMEFQPIKKYMQR